jgi:hypothetical protein
MKVFKPLARRSAVGGDALERIPKKCHILP